MNFKKIIKEFWADEVAPKPLSRVITSASYYGDVPEVSFAKKIYYHSVSPQLQVGVTGYARLLDLANIMINADDEESKKIIEDWIQDTNFKTKLEAMGNTFLICGNAILEKLDDKIIQDVAEVDMSSIIDKKRDEFGNTQYYIQQLPTETRRLGETSLKRYIEFNLSTISRSAWSPCIFEAAAIPRKVGNRTTYPLVELVIGLEDAMSTIILNNAYPEVYYTFEGANEEELKRETEKLRKKKPGDRMIATKKPLIELFESKGQSAYVDYIKYLYNSLSLSVKFPTDILIGDFTSRASSEESANLPVKIAASIKRYLGNKLKQELFDLILIQNGKDPKKANLQVTFGIQEIIKITPEIVGNRVVNGIWTKNEAREWDKNNSGVDLFDDINQDLIPVDDKKGGFVMKPRIIKKEKIKEGFGDTITYRLDYGHDKIDVCDDYADEMFDIESLDYPELPLHPNCKCYYEDSDTGEYLGQDPKSALIGSVIVPEKAPEPVKIPEPVIIPEPKIDETIQKRADEIKEQFFTDTVDKAVKELFKSVVDELRDTIEERKFNKKAKTDILEKLNRLAGDENGT